MPARTPLARRCLILISTIAAAWMGASSARAAYVVTYTQVGPNVVATGAGSLNLSGFVFAGNQGGAGARTAPSFNANYNGPLSATATVYSVGFGGIPYSFGPGGLSTPTAGSGDFVGISAPSSPLIAQSGNLSVPFQYAGGPLVSSNTYANQTLATLGLTPGSYVYPLQTGGVTRDTYTINVVATPEPTTLTLATIGLGTLARRRNRRRG